MSAAPARVRILYDADCGFCRWSLAWLLRWDRRRRLEPVALQDRRADELLGGIDEELKMASWHLVGADGGVASAGAAAAPVLRLLPGGAPLAWLFARLPGPIEWSYRRVVEFRGPLGRGLSEAALARADRLIAERRPP